MGAVGEIKQRLCAISMPDFYFDIGKVTFINNAEERCQSIRNFKMRFPLNHMCETSMLGLQ
jgi:hypothetical protein